MKPKAPRTILQIRKKKMALPNHQKRAEKVKPVLSEGGKEREHTEYPHKSSDPFASKAQKNSK